MALARATGGAVDPDFAVLPAAWQGLFHGPLAVGCYLAEDGRVLFANDAMIDLLGHDFESLARGWTEVLFPDPEERRRTWQIIAQLARSDAPTRHQRLITRADGTQRLAYLVTMPFALPDGRRVLYTTAFDLTRLGAPLGMTAGGDGARDGAGGANGDSDGDGGGGGGDDDGVGEVLARFDARTGRCLYVTRSIERLCGFTPEALYADSRLIRRRVLPEFRAAHDEAVRRCVAGEPQWTVMGVRGRDEQVVQVHQTFYPVRDATGHVMVVETLARDVTALKELETRLQQTIGELRERNEELASLDRLKSSLLANVSHELRTPLVSIKGYNELLLRGALGPLTERQRRGLETAGANTERLIELIETLLDFAHHEEGRLAVRRAALDLRLPVRDALTQVAERMRALGIDLRVDLGVDPLPILGDHGRLVQVLRALLSNAEKFCQRSSPPAPAPSADLPAGEPDRPPVVEVLAGRVGGEARLLVRDSGIGIPAAAQEKVFGRFYQVDASPTRRFGGAGLGLALAREIIGLHGGRITLESTEGEGAAFAIWLPLAPADEPRRTDEPLVLLGVAPGSPLAGPSGLRALLEADGFSVLEASTVSELVRRARRHRPDALVLGFPTTDVLESLRLLRAAAETHGLPLLALIPGDRRADALSLADAALGADEIARVPARLHRLLDDDPYVAGSARPRVFIVDDEPGILDFTRFVLESEGFDVSCALSGDAAIDQVTGDCDLAILDVVFQGRDGLDLCRRLKRSASTAAVPVLVITARADGEVRRESFAAGADGFLLKPFSVDDFVRQVRLHVRPRDTRKKLDTPESRD